MGRLTPGPGRTITDVFAEKINGTDKFLVSAETIAYLKWLIYVAAFKERGNVAHEVFYNKELAFLNHPRSARWRSFLCAELLQWYILFPSFKKRKSRSSSASVQVVVYVDRVFKDVDGFQDPLEHIQPPSVANSAAGSGGV